MKQLSLSLLTFLAAFHLEAQTKPYRIGAFLPSSPKTRTWITVQNGIIQCLDKETKKGAIPHPKNCLISVDAKTLKTAPAITTESYLVPGFMDLHNHIEFNSLPLWQTANGQFKNRFEWRDTDSYQNGPHKFYMRLMKLPANDVDNEIFKEFACLSLQWSELKALTGGVTAIQGMGRRENEACARDFGIRNLEIAKTMGLTDKVISGSVEVMNPEMIETGFLKYIAPEISTDYQTALNTVLNRFEINAWINDFVTKEHTIENGLRLTLGPVVEKYLMDKKLTQIDTADFVLSVLNAESDFFDLNSQNEIQSAQKRILNFLFEPKIEGQSYLSTSPSTNGITKTALSFLSPNKFSSARESEAVLFIPRDLREYVATFEKGQLEGLRKRLSDGKLTAYLTHLAEGSQSDEYNSKEFSYARTLGIMQKTLVPIHGVGFTSENFQEMAKTGQGLVLSPFSNLLLYGESVKIKDAVSNKIPLAIGSDWSITGSKIILDEVRVLKNYASKNGVVLSSKQLVSILTESPAKILGVSDRFGKIALGFNADFSLIKIDLTKKPYDTVIESTQENIALVVSDGEPLYGDTDLLEKVSLAIDVESKIESIEVEEKTACASLKKSFRLFNSTTQTGFSYKNIKSQLTKIFAKASDRFKLEMKKVSDLNLDPVFVCEDKLYQNRIKLYLQ